MADKPKNEPFLLLTKEAANAPPRVGPTMAAILEMIAGIRDTCGQVLKRQQQLALMVDGAIATLNRRFDVLHEEQALMRVSMARPQNDTDVPVDVELESEGEPAPRKPRNIVLGGIKVTSYLTTVAVLLRLVGKHVPEYGAAIDGLLESLGL
jgi:hypothetical protein